MRPLSFLWFAQPWHPSGVTYMEQWKEVLFERLRICEKTLQHLPMLLEQGFAALHCEPYQWPHEQTAEVG